MANVTYTGASSTSPLLVSSSGGSSGGIGSPCDPREPPPGAPPLPGGGMGGIGVGGYDLMTYQRLASALYAHQPPTLDPTAPTGAPTMPTALLPHNDPLLHGNGLDLKESLGGLGGAWPYPMYPYPYDLAGYSFTHGYGMAFDAARRKNATRETTSTLKAWLNEHKKNPYPTKGEKIMLAIITKMTLTQVSTWFANARRRLKKENKMTWEPRNKADDEDDEDDDKDYDVSNTDDMDNHVDGVGHGEDLGRPGSPLRPPSPSSTTGAGGDGRPPAAAHPASTVKPRIWSLADMASSSSGPTSPSSTLTASASAAAAVGKMSLYRPLHLEVSPYARPLPMSPRLPSPQEALLQVYAKSLGLAPPHGPPFPVLHPHTFNGLGATLSPPRLTEAPLPPSLQLYSSALTGVTNTISRPVATRPVPPPSPGSRSSPIQQHTLPGGAKITPAPHPTPGHRPEG